MDRDEAVEYVTAYYKGGLNVAPFLADYITTRGKSLEHFNELITVAMASGILDKIVEFAITWCRVNYDICVIQCIKTDGIIQKTFFITAY